MYENPLNMILSWKIASKDQLHFYRRFLTKHAVNMHHKLNLNKTIANLLKNTHKATLQTRFKKFVQFKFTFDWLTPGFTVAYCRKKIPFSYFVFSLLLSKTTINHTYLDGRGVDSAHRLYNAVKLLCHTNVNVTKWEKTEVWTTITVINIAIL